RRRGGATSAGGYGGPFRGPPSSSDARQPGMIAPARQALGEVPAGPLRVTGAEARLEKRVVEDVALGARSAELHEAGPQRLDLRDARPAVALAERVAAPDQRADHVGHP